MVSQAENAQKLKFPITSCLDRKWHKKQSFEGIFQDMEALGYSIVVFVKLQMTIKSNCLLLPVLNGSSPKNKVF